MTTVRFLLGMILLLAGVVPGYSAQVGAGEPGVLLAHAWSSSHESSSDSLVSDSASFAAGSEPQDSRSVWGLDILLSNNGFGLGAFHRREFTDDLSGFVSLSVSESKDDREIEQYDYFGNVFIPGKLSRFLVIPLMVGVQYRLFREDITESFRPYLNAGAGPTLIYASPFIEIVPRSTIGFEIREVEFFKSLGKGQPHYTAGAFVGIGANLGSEKSSVVGVNLRYYFTYLLGGGLPSLYDNYTGEVAGTKKDFGGFFITFNIGFSN